MIGQDSGRAGKKWVLKSPHHLTAVDTTLERDVAIKLLHRAGDEKSRERFRREALVLLTFGALTILFAAQAAAQPRWGRPQVPRSGACFYRDVNFQGEYFCVSSGEDLPSIPRGLNDEISSIRTFGSVEITVYRDDRFNGRSTRFNGNVPNLKNEGWNDRLSSARIRGRVDIEVQDEQSRVLVRVYEAYDAQCQREGVVDFAELMLRTYELMRDNTALREHYQRRFRHILIDEFQDTNRLQYAWIKMFAQPRDGGVGQRAVGVGAHLALADHGTEGVHAQSLRRRGGGVGRAVGCRVVSRRVWSGVELAGSRSSRARLRSTPQR